MLLALKPLGLWGLAGIGLFDAAVFPIPVSMDAVVIGYVAEAHRLLVPICVVAALAGAVGGLVPYYIGRGGGELFLLKRVNRERYEALRDRFERQEFLGIMIPATLPPPTPMKLFQFAAGVFEMRPVPFVLAMFTGKMIQYLVCGVIVVLYGPAIVHDVTHAFHRHAVVAMACVGLVLVGIGVSVARRVIGKRGSSDEEEETVD
jgi:membrane protein YqaA with SNARE-associated domain